MNAAQHRLQAESWASAAKRNLDQVKVMTSTTQGAPYPELKVLVSAAHAQAALAQVHATLAGQEDES